MQYLMFWSRWILIFCWTKYKAVCFSELYFHLKFFEWFLQPVQFLYNNLQMILVNQFQPILPSTITQESKSKPLHLQDRNKIKGDRPQMHGHKRPVREHNSLLYSYHGGRVSANASPPIYLNWIFPILQFEISSLMNWIFFPSWNQLDIFSSSNWIFFLKFLG